MKKYLLALVYAIFCQLTFAASITTEQAQQKAQDTSGHETAGQEQKGAQYQSVFDDDKKAKSGKAGKIAIVVLSVILALLVIALGLKLIAPDSILSQKIDNMADSVMDEISLYVEQNCEAEILKEVREIR